MNSEDDQVAALAQHIRQSKVPLARLAEMEAALQDGTTNLARAETMWFGIMLIGEVMAEFVKNGGDPHVFIGAVTKILHGGADVLSVAAASGSPEFTLIEIEDAA